MRALCKLGLGIAAFAWPVLSQANAATLVPVTPPSGAVQTIVFGINNLDVIAGAYIDANNGTHGFVGPLNGTYTTFDFGGASTGTVPRALDDAGDIVGFAADPNFTLGEEFLRPAHGTIGPITKNGAPLDGVAQGINLIGETSTGDYIDPNTGARTGYLARKGVYRSDVTLGLNVFTTNPRSLNYFGTLAGFYVETDRVTTHGFILSKWGRLQIVDADDSGTTALEGINIWALATGQVLDSSDEPHSFVYNSTTGKFSAIDIPDGSAGQQAWGVNDLGQIAVSTSKGLSYIYCLSKFLCPQGGTMVPDGRSWKAKPGASLHYDHNGRTGVKAAKTVHLPGGALSR